MYLGGWRRREGDAKGKEGESTEGLFLIRRVHRSLLVRCHFHESQLGEKKKEERRVV